MAEVRYDGTGATAEMILDGEYEAEDLDKISQLFIKHMMRQTQTILPATITREEFIGKLATWPESTTTSPSGLHLGHYQVLRKRHNFLATQKEEEARFEAQRDLVIRAHLALFNYALKFGYSYYRWQKVINVMLKKDKSNSFIHRLRVIHIYEADYNLLLGVKWRQAMHHAEDHNLLNVGLYGSRPGRSAHDPVFLDLMQNEIYRTSMKSGITKDLDATSCYDRILAWVANVCSQRVGVHPMVAAVNSRTLERARFHLKTDRLVSEGSYQHCNEHPIHGTGQGSGNSPALWCFVSSTLFDAFAERAHGASFYSYDGQTSLQIGMVGFVDDCNQRVNVFRAHPQPKASQLIHLMKHDAQLWNDLLRSSGGALELPKCSFQLIESDWSARGRPFLKGFCDAPPLIISNDEGHVQIKQTSSYQARRTLGIHLCPSGTMKRQYEILLQRSKQYADIVLPNTLSHREARIMFHGIFIPSITYPLALTSLTEGQCCGIETPFMKVILPKCGYNRTICKAIRYGPISMGGAGFFSLHVEQTIQVILTALKHLRSPHTQPGKMLIIALSWAQAYAGVSWSLWEHPERKIPSTPSPWIQTVQQALRRLEAQIIISADHIPPRLREHDWYLMDKALDLNIFTNTEIEDINAYRRFFQVTTAADITDARGVRVREDVWNGTGNPTPREFLVEFFNQARPDQRALRTWKKFMEQIANKNRCLVTPLGKWITTHQRCRRQPIWIHNPKDNNLYQCTTTHDGILYRSTGRFFHVSASCPQEPTTLPENAYPTEVLGLGTATIPRCNYLVSEAHSPQPETFQEYIQGLPSWEQHLLQTACMSENPSRTAELINDGEVIFIASDGSVIANEFGTFSYIITHVQSRCQLAWGNGPVPGAHPSSFRAEAYGVLAASRFLFHLSTFTGIKLHQRIRHWIDNAGLVKRIRKMLTFTHEFPNATLAPDWDVMTEILHSIRSIPDIQYSAHWIKSHQDSATAYDNLTLAAQMNCDADMLASDYHQSANGLRPIPIVPMKSHTHAQLRMRDTTITAYYKKAIRDSLTTPPLHQYLQSRFGWTDDVMTELDWEMFSTLTKLYNDQRPTLVKHVHMLAPTGKYAHRNDAHESAGCPACDCDLETNEHLFQCPAMSREEWREATIRMLSRDNEDPSVDPTLNKILIDGIGLSFKIERSPLDKALYPAEYHGLIDYQNKVGWSNMFRCRWVKDWRRLYTQWAFTQSITRPTQAAQKWVETKGKILLSQWWVLWHLRNDERHKRDDAQISSNLRLVVQSKLEELYSKRTKVMRVDRDMFPYGSAQEHLSTESSLNNIHDWCLDNGPAINASCTQAQQLGVVGTGDIRGYFNQCLRGTDSDNTQRR
jgi:hypothetical protein